MFKTVAKNKRLLMWTFFLICMSQTAHFALASGIDLMQRTVFPDKALSAIQTVMSLPSLLSVFAGILSAVLIGTGLATKKALTVAGIALCAGTGLLAVFLHSQFWQVIAFGILLGTGMGLFIPTSQSIMMDRFDEKERQLLSGLQFSFVNLGGIAMSILGGLMITLVWYGGYLMLLILLPVAILSIFALPKEQRVTAPVKGGAKVKPARLPADVFYYAAALFLFSMMYTVSASNISTHLSSNGLGNAATAGAATAVLLAGGVVSGAFFHKLSQKLGDYLIAVAFTVLFLGYSMMNIFAGSLPLVFVSVFVAGASVSLCLSQCIFSASNRLDPTNSATGATILSTVAPGIGGFLSPIIFTNVTQWLGGDSTRFRFQFVAFCALLVAVVFFLGSLRRSKGSKVRAEAVR